jgi:hypothetical protein
VKRGISRDLPIRGWEGAPSPAKRGRDGEGVLLRYRFSAISSMLLPDLTNLARDLRQQMTDAERFLWSRLRRRFLGAKFRRQVPLGPFIVDFACMRSKLVVERTAPGELCRCCPGSVAGGEWVPGAAVLES